MSRPTMRGPINIPVVALCLLLRLNPDEADLVITSARLLARRLGAALATGSASRPASTDVNTEATWPPIPSRWAAP